MKPKWDVAVICGHPALTPTPPHTNFHSPFPIFQAQKSSWWRREPPPLQFLALWRLNNPFHLLFIPLAPLTRAVILLRCEVECWGFMWFKSFKWHLADLRKHWAFLPWWTDPRLKGGGAFHYSIKIICGCVTALFALWVKFSSIHENFASWIPLFVTCDEVCIPRLRRWPHSACKSTLWGRVGAGRGGGDVGGVWAAWFAASGQCHSAAKFLSMSKLIVMLHCSPGQQVKGMVIIERRISKTLNIRWERYHYP